MVPGDVIAERFELTALAGTGGMGAVYEARDRLTNRHVAVKVLRHGDGHAVERFRREAQVLTQVRHPGIVSYVTHGTTASGELYIVMEWLEGENLSQRLSRHALTIDESLGIVLRLAEALSVAHERGIVHRDVKPNNVFLVGGDPTNVRLLDFGVARLRSTDVELTQTGAMIGTPGYMSPEQARGEPEVDARADVFALGCVLFRCLTGRPAFAGDDVLAVLLKVVLEEAPRVTEIREDVPEPVADLCARLLSKAREGRPPHAGAVAELIRALGKVQGGRAPHDHPSLPALTASERRLMCVLLARLPTLRSGEKSAPPPSVRIGDRHRALRSAVEQYGGRLDFFADGTLVVHVIGVGPATDHAARAARCGLAMHRILPEAPIVIAAGRGELTGRVPMGEVIDRAVALLALGPPGRVRVDQVAVGLLDVRFDVRGDEGGLFLAGERDVAEAQRTLLGRPTTCVGRDRELVALESIWNECTSEPVARAVLVSGPAGAGKSRLRYELLRRLEQRGEPMEVLIGRGDPMSAGAPFSVIAPPIRHAAGIRAGEAPAVRAQKLRARISRHLSRDADRVVEFIGELVGVPASDEPSVLLQAARHDPVLLADQMRRAWEDWLRAECAQQPVVLVLEDLQWGDLPSVLFVDAALRALSDAPLLVLAFARNEVLDAFPRLWEDREMQHIRLAPLTKKSCERLARQVLGATVGEETVARIVERSGGNAFYLEELIRAVAEGKGDELPSTVLAMVQARLEALDGEARRTLRAASVFGQVFWRGGVVALLGGEEAAWTPGHGGRLEELAQLELVSPRAESRLSGEREYVFRSALVREAAYGMLTDQDRKLGHRLAAAWLESQDASEAVVLAEHYERGGDPERAATWYLRAAEQAMGANDFAGVLAHGKSAERCGAIGERLGAILALEAEAENYRGEHTSALELAQRAMSHLPPKSPSWCAAAGGLAIASGRLARFDELESVARLLADVGPSDVVGAERVIAAVRAATPLLLAGRMQLAEALFALAERADASAAQNPIVLARLNEARGLRALFLGDPVAYISFCDASAICFEKGGDLRGACMQRVNAGCVSTEIGAYEEAEVALRGALEVAERTNLRAVAAGARNNLGMALARQGRLEEALAIERQTIAESLTQGFRRLEAASRMYLATILSLRGDADSAAREARAAVEMTPEMSPIRAQALATEAQVLLLAGRVAEALEPATTAHQMLEALGGVDEGEAQIRLVYAEVLHASQRVDEARAAIASARERVLAKASKITDPVRRRMFLDRVPENARTLGLAREWGLLPA